MILSRLKSNAKNKRVLSSLIFSYLIILFLPVAIWIISLLMYSNIIEEQTDELNRNMLALIREAVDRELDDITLDYMVIASNPTVRRIIATQNNMSVRDTFDVRTIINILNSKVAQNDMLDSIFIYFNDSDFVISNETKVSSEHFYNFSFVDKKIDIPIEEWINLIKQTNSKKYVYLNGKISSGRIAYFVPLPSNKVTEENVRAVLVFILKPDAIANIINSIDTFEDVHVAIFNDNQLLATSYNYSPKESDENHDNYISTSVISSKHGLNFVSYMPKSLYFQKLSYLRRFTAIYFIAVLLICSIIIIYSLKKNYNPLNELILYIEDKLNKICRTNEYDYLKDSLKSIIDGRTKDKQLLEEQNIKIRNAYIERLLLGNADMGIPMDEYLSLLGLDFKSGEFAVILIDFYNMDNLEDKRRGNLKINVDYSNTLSGYCVNIAGRTAFLVDCISIEPATLRERAEKLFNTLNSMYEDIVMAVSSIHKSALGIPSAYDEALYSLEYIFSMGSQTIIFYEDISKSANTNYYYPPEEERRFINAVVSGDINEALFIYNNIWQQNIAIKMELAKLLMHNFLSSLFKAFTEGLPSSSPDAFPLQLKILHMDFHSIEDIRKELHRSVETVCEYMKKMSNDDEEELKNRIISYIKNNYMDCNLSVEQISEKFGRSRSSLFSIFKSKTGEGLLYTINKIRIEAAKELLAENNLGTTETAKAVGYTNVGTFLRVFKKFVGTTPGQYKEIILNYKNTIDNKDK